MKKISVILFALTITCIFSLSVVASIKSENNIDDKIYKGVVSYVNKRYPNINEEEKTKLIKELYEEKSEITSKKPKKKNKPASVADSNKVDEAYKRVMDEENYVVDLINSQGESTSLDKWEFNLNYLKNNYNTIKNISDINLTYIDSYIDAYEWELIYRAMPDQKINLQKAESLSVIQSSDYESSDAVQYAEDYYDNYNDDYPDWGPSGGDCANFVSQCLHAGGKPMEGTPGTSAEATDWSNWFSEGSTRNTKKVSSTWRGANAFKSYWHSNATDDNEFTEVDSDSFDFGWKGDAVSLLNSNGRAFHTLIIVGYDSPDFICRAHSDVDSDEEDGIYLSTKDYDFKIYNMR